MASLFVTGASGLIGRRLLQRIDAARYDAIYCLTRGGLGPALDSTLPPNVVQLRGSLADPDAYTPCLAACETVVHLAARTGKARPSEYIAVNVRGTETLLTACERTGVANFLHVSTIAAKQTRDRRYYYAHSKRQAEATVRRSELRHTIVRPTIVLAPDARIWKALSGLARLPRPVVFGDGTAMIQPILLDDLITCLLLIIDQNRFAGEILEIGGPEPVRFGSFLRTVHRQYSGSDAAPICVPIAPVRAALVLLERPLHRLLPLSAGQLAAFTEDGTIEPNPLHRQCSGQMHGVDDMVNLLVRNERGSHVA